MGIDDWENVRFAGRAENQILASNQSIAAMWTHLRGIGNGLSAFWAFSEHVDQFHFEAVYVLILRVASDRPGSIQTVYTQSIQQRC